MQPGAAQPDPLLTLCVVGVYVALLLVAYYLLLRSSYWCRPRTFPDSRIHSCQHLVHAVVCR